MSQAEKNAYVQARVDDMPSVDKYDKTGLRIDIAIENEDSGETKWVDVTVAHTGAESYLKKELHALKNRQIASQLADNLDILDPLKADPNPSPLSCNEQRRKYKNTQAYYSLQRSKPSTKRGSKLLSSPPSLCRIMVRWLLLRLS